MALGWRTKGCTVGSSPYYNHTLEQTDFPCNKCTVSRLRIQKAVKMTIYFHDNSAYEYTVLLDFNDPIKGTNPLGWCVW